MFFLHSLPLISSPQKHKFYTFFSKSEPQPDVSGFSGNKTKGQWCPLLPEHALCTVLNQKSSSLITFATSFHYLHLWFLIFLSFHGKHPHPPYLMCLFLPAPFFDPFTSARLFTPSFKAECRRLVGNRVLWGRLLVTSPLQFLLSA